MVAAARSLFVATMLAAVASCGAPPPPALGPLLQLSEPSRTSQIFLNTAKSVAVDGSGVIHVAWLDVVVAAPFPGHARQGRIAYVRSTDGGESFSAPRYLTVETAELGTPKLATSGDALFMVWHQTDGLRSQITFLRSDDGGLTFVPAAAPLGPGTYPSIDAWSSGGGAASVHVAWSDSQVPSAISEIHLASSGDGGRTFSAPVSVSVDDGRSSWTAAVASSGPTVHVGWTDERFNLDGAGQPYDCGVVGGGATCHEEEFYRRSTDGGLTFPEPEVRLTIDPPGMPKYSWAPSIVASGQEVHLSYFDARDGAFQIFYRRSLDDGRTWEAERSLTGGVASQPAGGWWRPSLAWRGGARQLVFWRQADLTRSSVWTVGSTDDGTTWSSPVEISESSTALQPAVALGSDGTAHFVWYDSAAGTDQVVYRRMAPPPSPLSGAR